MIPNPNAYELDNELENDFEERVIPDRTYRLDFENQRIVGAIDEMEARKQAIKKIIMTEAEEYLIYDDNYGCALVDLIGEQPPLVQSDIRDSIREGILSDDRFASVSFIEEKVQRGKVCLSLTVTCTDDMEIKMEEEISV